MLSSITKQSDGNLSKAEESAAKLLAMEDISVVIPKEKASGKILALTSKSPDGTR